MDTTKARSLASSAATAAGRAVAGAVHRGPRPTDGPVAQTLTVAAPVGDVYAACRDVAVLSRLVAEDPSTHDPATHDPGDRDAVGVRVAFEPPRHYRWTVAGRPVDTDLVVDPHGLTFTTNEGRPLLSVEVHPAPQDLGSEVRFALDLPVPDLAAGGLAFTMLYRLRALLQTGEVPTLGDVPSNRREGSDA